MAPTPLRILCFGDSLTSGFWHFGAEFWPYSHALKDRVAAEYPERAVTIVTDGVPGDLASPPNFAARMQRLINDTAVPFDWTIVLAGTNDIACGVAPAKIFAGLDAAWDHALASGSRVLAMTVPECHARNEALDRRRDELNTLIKNQQRHRCHVFDLESCMPFHSLSQQDQELFWDDGLHMTDKGYDWMGALIADEIIHLVDQGENVEERELEAAQGAAPVE